MEYECKYCKKILKHKSSLYHHQIHSCKKRPNYKSKNTIINDLENKIKIKNSEVDNLNHINKMHKKYINKLENEIKDLKKEMKKLRKIEKDKYRLEGEVKVYKKIKIK